MSITQTYSGITSLETYNARMGKSIIDKLFFVDKIEPDAIIDFGSADGCLIEHLLPWFPETTFIGYDIEENMVKAGNARFQNKGAPVIFTSAWGEVQAEVKTHPNAHAALILSSIIHEVYHYQDPVDVDIFWQRVLHSGFDYIVIRDMIPSRSIDRPSDVGDVARIYRRFLNTPELADFERIWGSIENNRNLIHFLLKYKYTEPNWDREVKENYFPMYREELLARIPENYRVMYSEHFVLPYIKRNVRNDFGIEMKDPTHFKLILEKR